jgi:hypothetical protein
MLGIGSDGKVLADLISNSVTVQDDIYLGINEISNGNN